MSVNPEPRGNLIEYGIRQEKTDYRCHVCFGEQGVYLYRTDHGLEAIETREYVAREARQPGVEQATALGYAVPIEDIRDIRRVEIPFSWLPRITVTKDSGTTEKGKAAVQIVRAMLKRGMLPISLGSDEVGDQRLQIDGTDLIIDCKLRIQVKCDWDGGLNGTGNLFIQTHEMNPKKLH